MQRQILALTLILCAAPAAAAGGYANARYLDSYDYCGSYLEDQSDWWEENGTYYGSQRHYEGDYCSSYDETAVVAAGDDDGQIASANVGHSDWNGTYSYYESEYRSEPTGPNSSKSGYQSNYWNGDYDGSVDSANVNSRFANASLTRGCYNDASGGGYGQGSGEWSWDPDTGDYESQGASQGWGHWNYRNACQQNANVGAADQNQGVGVEDGCWGRYYGQSSGTDESTNNEYHRDGEYWSSSNSFCGRTASAAGATAAVGGACQGSFQGRDSQDYSWSDGNQSNSWSSTMQSQCDNGAFLAIPNGTLFLGNRHSEQNDCVGQNDNGTCETTNSADSVGATLALWDTPAGPIFVDKFVPLTP